MSELPLAARLLIGALVVSQIALQVYGVVAWLRLFRGQERKDYVSLFVIVLGQLVGALIGIFVLLPQRRAELETTDAADRTAYDPSALASFLEAFPTATTETSVEFTDVSKSYGNTRALDRVSLDIGARGAVGILGPNGAGKTTLIKVLLSLVHADSGTVSVLGEKPGPSARMHIGYCPDVPAFDSWMTGRDVLVAEGFLLGLDSADARERASAILRIVGLANARGRVGGWSRGMRQRLALGRALVGTPAILVLDEPTSALDPAGRADILDLISTLSTSIAIIFSTHRIEDIDRVCDHIVMLDDGRVLASATKAEFARRSAAGVDVVVKSPALTQRQEIKAYCDEHGLSYEEIRTESLEALFLEMTGAR